MKNNLTVVCEKWFPVILAIICFGGVLISRDIPGIYLDAVNPDYYAVQILNPSEYSSSWFLPHLGIPLLGQLYHGTITMICQLITILITGSTSALQLRLLNCCYGYACCLILWKILKKTEVNGWIASIVVLILSLSPNLVSFYRTQYYIMLPGVFFFLLSVFYAIKWKEDEKDKTLLLMGIFTGLSFYDYFSFGFCIPGFIITILYIAKKNKRNIRKTLALYLIGLIIGCIPYLIGYSMLILAKYNDIAYSIRIVLALLFAIVFGVLIVYFYRIQIKEKLGNKDRIKTTVVLATMGILIILFAILALHSSRDYLISLNVAGTEAGFIQRIKLLIQYTKNVLNHSSLEYLVMGETIQSSLHFIPLFSLLISFAISVHAIIRKRFSTISITIVFILIGSLFYYLLSIIFASRMQSQHFVVMLFVNYLLLGLSFGELLRISKESIHTSSLQKATAITIICVFGFFAFTCITSQNTISMKMKNDRKIQNMYYTQAVDKIAETALQNHDKSIDEYYIFPEWGLMCGFDYLTCNTIPFCDHFDEGKIAKLQEEGYDIVVCYFDAENEETYKQQLQSIIGNVTETKESILQCWGSDLYILTV